MYRTLNQRMTLFVMTALLAAATVSAGYAQESPAVNKLRETPRQETVPGLPITQPTIGIDVWLNKPCGSPFYTGEKAVIYFNTTADGYVTIYDIDTQGKVLVIFPNEYTPDNYVKAGQNYQIPAREARYDLIVEGPEGIEYLDAVASTDPYYHWDYRQGEPRWLRDWGLKGQRQQEVRVMDPSVVSTFQKSAELQNLPKEFGEIAKKSLSQNFQLSQNLREHVRTKLAERPRETPEPTPGSELKLTPVATNYSTASCYLYVVDRASKTSPFSPSSETERRTTEGLPKIAPTATPRPSRQGAPRVAPITNLQVKPKPDESENLKITPVSRTTIQIDLWLDKQCGSPYYTGEKAIIYFSTDVDGYVTLYDIDTQGQVTVIFPNRNTPDNFVKGGRTYQIPAREADYDLIVEGPEGIEYLEAVASTNVRYHWNYQQGEPRWLQDWGLKGRPGAQQEVRVPAQSGAALSFSESSESRTLPKEFGAIGQKSVTQNFQLSRSLQEQIRSQIAVTPRESDQPSTSPKPALQPVEKISVVEEYSTASCYFYVVAQVPQTAIPLPSNLEYLRQQERDLQQIPDFDVRRLEDRLIVEMPARVLFDVNSFDLRYQAKQDLEMVTNVLLRYPDTTILVMGHTDSDGSAEYNQRLSESRAMSVTNYFLARGVAPTRIQWLGYGKTQPVASNYTEEGRQRNRRVELEIRVSEQYGR